MESHELAHPVLWTSNGIEERLFNNNWTSKFEKKVCEVDHVRMNDHYLKDIKKIYHDFRLYKNDTSVIL